MYTDDVASLKSSKWAYQSLYKNKSMHSALFLEANTDGLPVNNQSKLLFIPCELGDI